MNEKLLHFIWQFGLFNQNNLQTTDGEKVEIVHPGKHNIHSGADFQHAKIRIGKTLWAGNVEIHVQSKDWFTHKHQTDKAYNNVILHVVNEANSEKAHVRSESPIPTLQLKEHINPTTLSRFDELSKRKDWIPCQRFFNQVTEITLNNLQHRLLIERLEGKVEQVNQLLSSSENDWENVMFRMVAKYLGAGINKEPFLQVAQSLPIKIWAKHQDDKLQIEALLFGQAGFLDEKYDDEYPNQLRKEYNYLKRLHNLQPLQKHLWKFLRLRPSNFPTVRLAQLAALMNKESKLFSAVLDARNAKAIHKLFDTEVSAYWNNHYQFDKPSKKVNVNLGDGMKNILLINAVAPVLFAYGKYKDNEKYCDRALQLLETCEAENNSIIKGWKGLGLKPVHAYETQALLQLKNEYCDKFRCLECAVAHSILK